jgi:hypothetical protein
MKNEAINIDSLSDKMLDALEAALSKKIAKKSPSSVRRRRPRQAYEQLNPQPSEVMRCIKVEREQGSKNAVASGWIRAKKELIEKHQESEQNFRRLYKHIAEGRIRGGDLKMARYEVLD